MELEIRIHVLKRELALLMPYTKLSLFKENDVFIISLCVYLCLRVYEGHQVSVSIAFSFSFEARSLS